MAVSGVDLDFGFTVAAGSSLGVIAGEAPGIVTIDNVPGRAEIDLFRRSDRVWLRRQFSMDDGTYRFRGLAAGVLHDLVARDISNAWDDVIAGSIMPFQPVVISGDAPPCAVGVPYSYAYVVMGGESPYTFILTGDLPDGLELVSDGSGVSVVGTPLGTAAPSAWTITVEDARGTTATISDSMGITTTRYWRLYFNEATDIISGYGRQVQVCEVEFNGVRATGGTPFASDSVETPPQFGLVNAFDGVKTGDNNIWAATYVAGVTLGYEFAAPLTVNSVSITSRENATVAAAWSPRGFIVQSSADGVSWVNEWAVSGQTGWTGNQTRVFNRP